MAMTVDFTRHCGLVQGLSIVDVSLANICRRAAQDRAAVLASWFRAVCAAADHSIVDRRGYHRTIKRLQQRPAHSKRPQSPQKVEATGPSCRGSVLLR